MRLISFGVEGLFGIFDHPVKLNQRERLTIIHGPNGFGKTTLLRFIRGFFSRDFEEFGLTPFRRFSMGFDDGRVVTIEKGPLPKEKTDAPNCTVSELSHGKTVNSQVISAISVQGSIARQLERRAPWMRFVENDTWQDTRDGEILDTSELYARFRVQPEKTALQPWLEELTSAIDVRLIATQRLSESSPLSTESGQRHIRISHRRTSSSSAIIRYAEQLSEIMRNTFLEYAALSQQLDRTFVVRLLTLNFTGGAGLFDKPLKSKIDSLNDKRARLRDAGLLTKDDQALPQPQAPYQINIDEILSAYLQDVENKLSVFDKLLAKIELLHAIMKSRLQFKTMAFSQERGLTFKTDAGEVLSPERLSSGEQHILIQIYDLLFSDKPNSLILIDEPEISLHVAWQLSFIEGLDQITTLVPHDIVLATHSPQIIGDRWELTVELRGPDVSADGADPRR